MSPSRPMTASTTPLAIRSGAPIDSIADANAVPPRTASAAYRKSAVAAPAPAENAGQKPRRMPTSMINIAIAPTGMAIPYPAATPVMKASIGKKI